LRPHTIPRAPRALCKSNSPMLSHWKVAKGNAELLLTTDLHLRHCQRLMQAY